MSNAIYNARDIPCYIIQLILRSLHLSLSPTVIEDKAHQGHGHAADMISLAIIVFMALSQTLSR